MGHQRHGFTPQLVLGLGAMALGLVLVLENFGLLQARRIVRYWPLLLIGMGLYRLYNSVRSRTRPAGHLLLLLGVFLLLGNLGFITPAQALGMFLLIGGAVLALRSPRREHGEIVPLALEGGRDLDLFAFMSYITRSVSDVFRGGQTSAIMGACEIDLRGAHIEGQAVINVFAFWGGVEIRVPSDWMVEGRGLAVLGAFEDKSRRPDDSRQKLIVTGLVIMGALEVKN